ncbi:MAG: AAA family ATPase [Amphritea sp.]
MPVTQTNQQVLAAAFESAQKRKDFYYEPQSRLQLVEKLEHLSRFSDFLLVITGPAGAGKSALLEQLQVAEADTTLRVCLVKGMGTVDLNALLYSLARQMTGGVPADADDQLLLSIVYEAASVMAAENIQWVVLVDDAMDLTAEAFSFLLQLVSDTDGPAVKPHLMLLGTADLLPRIQQDSRFGYIVKQIHHLELESFTEDEAKSYLLQRYSAAGSLTDKQLQSVYESSNGQPGGLNRAIEDLFRSGSVSRSKSAMPLPRLHLVSIAVVMVGVLAISLWQYWPGGNVQGDSSRTRVQLSVPVIKEASPEAGTTTAVIEIPVLQPAASNLSSSDKDKLLGEEPANSQVAEIASRVESRIEQSSVKSAEKTVAPEKAVGGSYDPVVVTTVKANTLATPVGVAKTQPKEQPKPVVVAKTQSQDQPKPIVVAKKQPKVQPKPVAVAKTQSQAQPISKSTVPAKPIVAAKSVALASGKAGLSAAEKTLMSWPKSGYTLQLLGAAAKDSAESFIQRQADSQKFYLFTASYKNKPWHVVVYGQYKNRAAAVAASKSLPDKLRKLKPWARSVQGIQTDIKQRKQ